MGIEIQPRPKAIRYQSAGRYDNLFFSSMALLSLVSVFVGFAHSYYLAGLYRAPLPNLLVHLHGAVFSFWIVLLVAQTSLVAAGRVNVHRRLGKLGFGIACLMVVMGIWVATDFEVRHMILGRAGDKIRAFYTVQLSAILSFAILAYFAFRKRLEPSAHKRLILIATIAILDAAFERWPLPAGWWNDRTAALLCTIPLLLLIMVYDRWSIGKIHPCTAWASALVVLLQQVRDPIGQTSLWQAFAFWVQVHARALRI